LIKNKVFKIVLGSSLQWYDFALYGFFSTVFAKLYFPSDDPTVALLASLSAFAIGFIARPLGAVLFGRFGDIYGRTKILKLTPLLITAPTVFLAVLPTYDSIGLLAPILLVCSRIMQGIFLGAEYGGNMVYLCESAPKNKFFLGSLASCSGSFGMLLASLIASLMALLPPEQLESFGWRIAFGLCVLPGIAAWYMRRNLAETPAYEELLSKHATTKQPMKDLLLNKSAFLIVLGILFFQASTFYYVFMFLPHYMVDHNNLAFHSFSIISLVLSIRLIVIPIIGKLADLTSGLTIFTCAAVAFVCCSFTLSKYFCAGEYIFLSFLGLGILSAINAGVIPGLITDIFPTRSRYTLFSLAFNAGFGIFGGCTPALCVYLGTFNHDLPLVLPICAGIIGLISIQFYKISRGELGYGYLQHHTK
jgi:MHS family proline/betaine transporter-like MFS transporter